MLKTLRSKITLIYLFLVSIIVVIGIIATLNLYGINKVIDNLISNNYTSINSASLLLESIDEQNISLLKYINTGDASNLSAFYSSSDNFLNQYNIEVHISKPDMKDHIQLINNYYLNFQNQSSELIEIRTKKGQSEALNFYSSNIEKVNNSVKSEINKLIANNEDNIKSQRNKLSSNVQESFYAILFISLSLTILGLVVSFFYTSKLLKPIDNLKKGISSLKNGHFKNVDITSNDEIGNLTFEFNSLISQIQEFEQSSKGKLIEEKQRSLSIIKGISDPIIVLDNNYKILLINDAFEHFFSVKSINAVSKHFLEVIRNYDLFNHIENAYNSDNNNHILKIISANVHDKTFYFDVAVTPINDRNSNINGVVVVFQNVTQLKKLDKARSDFISAVSHEFKTPLTSITMGISLLNEISVGMLNEKQREIVDSIKDGAENLSDLVTNLIQLSKIESDNEIFNIKPCSIFGIAENSIRNFTDVTEQKDINLYHDIDENIPKIMADQEKITWVLNNLISNAIKFTNAGDEISVSAEKSDNFICVSVKDTGIGIPKEYLKSIFDKFVKVDNPNNDNSGSGLGLTVAKKIINAHKGKIWCESEVDMGSTFYFTIPIAK